jgi:hypothetical protein
MFAYLPRYVYEPTYYMVRYPNEDMLQQLAIQKAIRQREQELDSLRRMISRTSQGKVKTPTTRTQSRTIQNVIQPESMKASDNEHAISLDASENACPYSIQTPMTIPIQDSTETITEPQIQSETPSLLEDSMDSDDYDNHSISSSSSDMEKLDSLRTSMATTKIQRWFRNIQANNAKKALKTLNLIQEKLHRLISESSMDVEQHPEWSLAQQDEYYRVYGEKLLTLFLELDNVASHGHFQVRKRRKCIANDIEKALTLVDSKRTQ